MAFYAMHSLFSFRFSRRRLLGAAAVAAGLGLAVSWGSLAAADEITDLRDGVPTGEEIREEIATVSAARDEVLVALNAAEGELTATLEARDQFDEEQRRLTSQMEAASDHLRTVAVRAYVSGGTAGELELLVNVSDVSDLSWRRHLLRNHAGSSEVALRRLRELEAQATDEVRESIEEAARLRDEIATFEIDVAALEVLIADARAAELLADAWDRAAIAIEEGRYGIAPAEKWERLRFCESTDNYQAINPTGKYRGAYQFDYATWQTVGGTGDPAAAPSAEQDARARELYARRGHIPWPVCGFHLQ
jgi:hypothetical protein